MNSRAVSLGTALARILLSGGIVLAAADCGSSGSAQPGSSIYVRSLAYAACMQSHGAPEFPDPELGPRGSLIHPLAPPHGMLSSPGYDKALRACEQLAPVSGRLTGRVKALVGQALSVAACMRARGITGYPDPALIDGGIHVPDLWAIGVDTHTPQFQAAGKACKAGDLWPFEWWWPAGSVSIAPQASAAP
jgi:hypothetical protein